MSFRDAEGLTPACHDYPARPAEPVIAASNRSTQNDYANTEPI
jgi:hypothetical protein